MVISGFHDINGDISCKSLEWQHQFYDSRYMKIQYASVVQRDDNDHGSIFQRVELKCNSMDILNARFVICGLDCDPKALVNKSNILSSILSLD